MTDLEEKSRAVWRGARHASVGLEVGVAVAIGAGIGWWLDGRYGWAPWGLMVGTLVGVGAGIKALVRVVHEVNRESAEDDRRAEAQAAEARRQPHEGDDGP
ncbi:MAG: AtpZ/AtpI family protein [Myxococcales bacterium]|nr:AtpZ/AtpI family protein [Myxococcales bacterium]MCB9545072.1 AtpZ/AtpI family protein [Myxococcales bacterium]